MPIYLGFVTIPDVIIETVVIAISIAFPFIAALLAAEKRKIVIALKIRRIPFFIAEFMTDTRDRYTKVILNKETKQLGKHFFFTVKGSKYMTSPKAMFRSYGVTRIQYQEGDPIPRMPFSTDIDSEIGASELEEAIKSKVVHDLLKFTFSRLEIVYLIVAIAGIGINIVVLYFAYTTAQEYSGLIQQLNGILTRLQAGGT